LTVGGGGLLVGRLRLECWDGVRGGGVLRGMNSFFQTGFSEGEEAGGGGWCFDCWGCCCCCWWWWRDWVSWRLAWRPSCGVVEW